MGRYVLMSATTAATHMHSKQAWQQINLMMETRNAAENYHILHEMKAEGRLKCLSDCPKAGGKAAIITGSGMSLYNFLPIASKWKGAIFCSSSHLSTYIKYGVHPTYVLSVDPRVALGDEFGAPPGELDETSYIAHVSCPQEYFRRWREYSKGMTYVYRILEPSYPWYTKHLPAIYPWIKVALLPFIDSVASQMQVAARLGYNPLYLIGCDYGGNRFNMWEYLKGEWHFVDNSKHIVTAFKGPGGLDCDDQLLYASRGALIGAYLQMMNEDRNTHVYQMSMPSNIVELPYRSLEYTLDHQDDVEEPWKEKYRKHYIHQIEARLAISDTYMVPTKGGYGTDYRVYMMIPPNFLTALLDINKEILINKVKFAELEKRFVSLKYADKLFGILDLQTEPKGLQNWLESPEGKAATEKAKAEEKKIEIHFLTIREQMQMGLLIAEKGEMMIHESVELATWDWRNMAPLDVEVELTRLIQLKRESESIPPIPPFAPVPVPPPIEGVSSEPLPPSSGSPVTPPPS
jgi:hypothetical protein